MMATDKCKTLPYRFCSIARSTSWHLSLQCLYICSCSVSVTEEINSQGSQGAAFSCQIALMPYWSPLRTGHQASAPLQSPASGLPSAWCHPSDGHRTPSCGTACSRLRLSFQRFRRWHAPRVKHMTHVTIAERPSSEPVTHDLQCAHNRLVLKCFCKNPSMTPKFLTASQFIWQTLALWSQV